MTRGIIEYCGKKIKFKNYKQAIKNNIAYLTEDRKSEGLALRMTMAENMLSARITVQDNRFVCSSKLGYEEINELNEKLQIVPPDRKKLISTFSGGNQQKVLLAKWLITKPKLLILDEPTRGVDVGAKEMIHHAILNHVKAGNGAIVISSDLMELIGLSSRIIILRQGRVIGEMESNECNEEVLLAAANSGVEC